MNYKRILLKLSGEALAGEKKYGIDANTIKFIAEEIKKIYELGIEIAIVIGGGNIFRGISASTVGMDRATADYMGMLATVINSLSLLDSLEKIGVPTRVQSAIEMREIAEPFIRRRALRHFEKKRVVIFAAGTGNPYFTTDTAAALRAAEIDADILLKATKVNGVYDKDPEKYSDAIMFSTLTFDEALAKSLKVMDITAFSMCKENNLPICVFNLLEKDNILKVVKGEKVGTMIMGG